MKTVIATLVIGVALAILRPWTIVPIETATVKTFDPAAYVASIWDARVVPAAENSAIELQTFIAVPPDLKVRGPKEDLKVRRVAARAVFVKGTAKISDVDTKSRVGLARLELPWAKAGGPTAAIQIGPVIRGTALRDALDFIRFTDFINQLEFASVAGALNDRALENLKRTPGVFSGAEVTFVGAVTTSGPLEIVPVRITILGGTR